MTRYHFIRARGPLRSVSIAVLIHGSPPYAPIVEHPVVLFVVFDIVGRNEVQVEGLIGGNNNLSGREMGKQGSGRHF